MTNHSTDTNQSSDFNPRLVDSLNHPLAKELRNLLSGSDMQSTDQIIIEDEENILQAIAGKIELIRVYTTDKNQLSKNLLRQLLPSVSIVEVSKRTCKKIFANTRQSELFATAKIPRPLSLQSLVSLKKDVVVLDGLSITGNIGAIIRTANAFDADAIIFLNSNLVSIYDRRVIRSSRGYMFRIPIIACTTAEFISFCKANQFDILLTSSHAKELIDEITIKPRRQAIVFGSEKEGCVGELNDQASYHVKIPMNAHVESLNVSVAASIFLYLRSVFWKKQ